MVAGCLKSRTVVSYAYDHTQRIDRVNVLGEALDGLGRWYVALPPFLIIGFLAALFFLTGAGQERLQEASERLQDSAMRELAIDQLQTVIARSVASQRGYLLTGNQRYLKSHVKVIADVEPRLERLRLAYEGSTSALTDVRTLHVLIGKRLVDLSMLLAIQQSQGTAAAVSLMTARPSRIFWRKCAAAKPRSIARRAPIGPAQWC